MKITVLIILIVFFAILVFYAYYGGFTKLKISVIEQGGELVVFESITGDYRQSGEVMDKIYYSLLNDDNIETFKGYGKYYDNPKKVEKEKLRSEAGCIIEPDDQDQFSAITGGYDSKYLPVKKYIVATFPYKGKISVMFSILKVYPALNKFSQQNNFNEEGAITEIYDIPNKTIYYRKEL